MRRTAFVLVFALVLGSALTTVPATFAQIQGGVFIGGGGGAARPGLPPRDAVDKVPTGTAVVSGRITAAASGAPLRHAQVTLNATDQPVRRSTTTDANGRYRFTDLPAGRYSLGVNKAGYVPLQYGQRRPTEPGTPLMLADAQVMNAANMALPKGSVIAGRVTDEFGEPIARAMVQALRYLYMPDGQRRPQPNASATTDDLGQFRLFGLTPGEYIVSASGQPGFVSSINGVSVVDTSETYLTSYFPGTFNIAEAQMVPLAVGQEATVQISLASGRLSRVAGTVVDSAGKPVANAMAMLQPPSGMFPMGGASSGMTGPDGAFSIGNVAPGEYVLNVQPVNRGGGEPAIAEASSVPLTVGEADILNLRIATSPGATVTGRVVFEGAARRDNGQGARIRVLPQAAGFNTFNLSGGGMDNGQVADDGTFELKGARGSLLFRIAAGPAWTLKSVSLDGKDITDTPTELTSAELSGVEIVLTDKQTDVSGQVTDARGRAVKDYLVVIQPAEPKTGVAMTRYLRTIRPDNDGRYRTRGLPPGGYVATAVETLEQGRQFVPEVQARLRDSARRFEVREGETVALDLKLTAGFE